MGIKEDSEQRVAIRHSGGVLLEAGAGSGKTFVLIQHVIYLTDQFVENNRSQFFKDTDKFTQSLKKFFSEIVILTFTKKAVGELAIRLNNAFTLKRDQEGDSHEKRLWKIVAEASSVITVSTIHSFCFKLISEAYFIDISPEEKILSQMESAFKIDKLLRFWLENQLGGPKDISRERDTLVDIILGNYSEIFKAIRDIFSDPYLREMWVQETKDVEIFDADLEEYFRELVEHEPFKGIFRVDFDHSILHDGKKNKWVIFLKEFFSLISNGIRNREDYLMLCQFFLEYKRLPPGPKKSEGYEQVSDYWNRIKTLKKFLTSTYDDFINYFNYLHQDFNKWYLAIKEIIYFIEDNYFKIPGITFSDLEYYVLKGFKDKKIVKKVSLNYKYFIIDEFQDVSYTQFYLIEKFLNGDFSRLFGVGDIKQSIYGFRGGELKVFLTCKERVCKNYYLKNNYRSKNSIIDFNNKFFAEIFKRGPNFQGEEKYRIPMNKQNFNQIDDDKLIYSNKLNLNFNKKELFSKLVRYNDSKKFNSTQVNFLEAFGILKLVINSLEKYPEEKIAILYKNLFPVNYLVPLLIENKISFTAQIKVPFGEDPIVGILKILLDYYFNRNSTLNDVSFIKMIVDSYLRHLHIENIKINDLNIELFFKDIKLLGVFSAYKKFLYSLEISNSNFTNNIHFIRDISKISYGDAKRVWNNLKIFSEDKYSFNYQYGDNPTQIEIMSVHSSKGLEFTHVILGGIYTNGRTRIDNSFLGRIPSSFKWILNGEESKTLKSPYYILEKLINDTKKFSESKRLFYVATTRAKKSINFVDLGLNDDDFNIPKNSWILGFNAFFDVENHTKYFNCNDSDVDEETLTELLSFSNQVPLYFRDTMGISDKINLKDNKKSEIKLGTVSELYVTKLASIADCPFKFYLQNICRLEDSDISIFEEIGILKKDVVLEKNQNQEQTSSAERGEKIHDFIYQIINRRVKLDEVPKNLLFPVKFAADLIEQYKKNYELIAEKLVKFSFFGYVLSGTPDLLLIPKNNNLTFEIWDYKSGQVDQSKLDSYWFQLYSYALASYKLKYLSTSNDIKISLILLDQQKILSKTINFESVKKFLSLYWNKLSDLDQMNLNMCPMCQYQRICSDLTI